MPDPNVRDAVQALARERRRRGPEVDGAEARWLRTAAGINVAELAGIIGVSGPTLSRMELGTLKGSPEVRERWRQAVDALRDELEPGPTR